MTDYDAVLDAAALEREAHMRATIVGREDATAGMDYQDRAMAAVHDEPAFRLQFIEAACVDKFRVWRVHKHDPSSKLDQRAHTPPFGLLHV
jgi:hypothetical protein